MQNEEKIFGCSLSCGSCRGYGAGECRGGNNFWFLRRIGDMAIGRWNFNNLWHWSNEKLFNFNCTVAWLGKTKFWYFSC